MPGQPMPYFQAVLGNFALDFDFNSVITVAHFKEISTHTIVSKLIHIQNTPRMPLNFSVKFPANMIDTGSHANDRNKVEAENHRSKVLGRLSQSAAPAAHKNQLQLTCYLMADHQVRAIPNTMPLRKENLKRLLRPR
jgi:hypothetical protein